MEGIKINSPEHLRLIEETREFLDNINYLSAKKPIDKLIFQLENSEQDINNWTIHLDNLYYFNNFKLEHDAYFYAAQIYGYLKDYDKSFLYNKRCRYYSINYLLSDFDKINFGYLYSFRPVSTYALSDLAESTITVCNPQVFNDPFDCPYRYWASPEILKSIYSDGNLIRTIVDSYKYMRVRSFSGNKSLTEDDSIIKNITMWSHYAYNHEGFCIKYKFSKNIITRPLDDKYEHWFLKMVKYTEPNQKINISSHEMTTDLLYATKFYQWEYEKEIRLINYDTSSEKDFHKIKLDEESKIDAIYFGYKCSDENILLIKRILGNNVKYFKMSTNILDLYNIEPILM